MLFEKAYHGKNGWWRYGLAIVGTIALFFVAQIPGVVFVMSESERLGIAPEFFLTAPLPADVDKNVFLLLLMLPFAIAFGVLWLFLRLLHGKKLRSVTTGRPKFGWRRSFAGFLFWFAILVIATFTLLPAENYSYQFDLQKFLPLLAIAIILVPIQTSTEEIFFRGYLLQMLGLLMRNKLLPLLIIVAVFVAVHAPNPEFSAGNGIGVFDYILMSTMLGLVTVLDDGLELPIGIHAANNLFLTVVISIGDGSLPTNAIFVTTMEAITDQSWLLLAVPYVAAFLVLYVVCGWRFSTLFAPIQPPADADLVPAAANQTG